jgi:hypothetical protein
MTTKRPAKKSGEDERRVVDKDGVVRVELRQGARPLWPYAIALAGLLAASGIFIHVWLGAPRGAPQASESKPSRGNARDPLALTGGGSRPPRAGSPGRGAGPNGAPLASLEPSSEGDPQPGARATQAPAEAPEGQDPEAEHPEAQGVSAENSPAPQGREGIGAFPLPGTKRIKPGIVVPEDFALPPGYVRHYQATDKGELLQAILMFHPDHKPVDAKGNPIPIPPDRVVPPELAPPGLPIETLKIPEDAYADRSDELPSGEEGAAPPEEEGADPAP